MIYAGRNSTSSKMSDLNNNRAIAISTAFECVTACHVMSIVIAVTCINLDLIKAIRPVCVQMY